MRKSGALTCPACHYDLAGLCDAATCPECGLQGARKRARAIVRQRPKPRHRLWNSAYVAAGIVAILTIITALVAVSPIGPLTAPLVAVWTILPYAILLCIAMRAESMNIRRKSAGFAMTALLAILGAGIVQIATLVLPGLGQPLEGTVVVAPIGATMAGGIAYMMSRIACNGIDWMLSSSH